MNTARQDVEALKGIQKEIDGLRAKYREAEERVCKKVADAFDKFSQGHYGWRSFVPRLEVEFESHLDDGFEDFYKDSVVFVLFIDEGCVDRLSVPYSKFDDGYEFVEGDLRTFGDYEAEQERVEDDRKREAAEMAEYQRLAEKYGAVPVGSTVINTGGGE